MFIATFTPETSRSEGAQCERRRDYKHCAPTEHRERYAVEHREHCAPTEHRERSAPAGPQERCAPAEPQKHSARVEHQERRGVSTTARGALE